MRFYKDNYSTLNNQNKLFSNRFSRVMDNFDMLESENIILYGRHRIQYKIDHTVSAVAMSPLSNRSQQPVDERATSVDFSAAASHIRSY